MSYDSPPYVDPSLYLEEHYEDEDEDNSETLLDASNYRCYDCNLTFDIVDNFLEHIRIHESSFSSSASASASASSSFSSRARNTLLSCPKCLKGYDAKSELFKHLKVSSCKVSSDDVIASLIAEQLSCSACERQFSSTSSFKNHVLKCNPSILSLREKPCLLFDESLKLQSSCLVNIFGCPIENCPKSGCITLRAFRMHAKCVHKQIDLVPIIRNVPAKYICKVRGCGKLFIEESQLEVHYKHHETYTPRRGKYICDLCEEGFYQLNMLKKHSLSSHSNKTNESFETLGSKVEEDVIFDSSLILSPGTTISTFKCPLCGKDSLKDIKSFKLHCKHIHPESDVTPVETTVEAQYICQVEGCGKLYIERRQFEIHLRHHRTYVKSKGRYFVCSVCESKFNTQSNLDVHVIQHHSENERSKGDKKELILDDISLIPGTTMLVYHCPFTECDKRNYIDAKSVRIHCKKVHGIEGIESIAEEAEAQFICRVRGCQKLFMSSLQMDAHLKHHRTYVPTNGSFSCSLCPSVFTRMDLLKSHTRMAHTNTPLMTSSTSSTSSPNSASSLKREALKVQGFKCSLCFRKFLVQAAYSKHVTDAHALQGIAPIPIFIKPKFMCQDPDCGKYFLTHQKYKLHVQNHALGRSAKDVLKCPKCFKNFSMFKSLHSHLLQNHLDTTEEEMRDLESKHANCLTCGKLFRDSSVLKQHKKIKGH